MAVSEEINLLKNFIVTDIPAILQEFIAVLNTPMWVSRSTSRVQTDINAASGTIASGAIASGAIAAGAVVDLAQVTYIVPRSIALSSWNDNVGRLIT